MTVRRSLLVDGADELVHVDEQVALVDRQRVPAALDGVALAEVGPLVGLGLEVEVLLPHRGAVVDEHRGVLRDLGLVLDVEADRDALALRAPSTRPCRSARRGR